MKKIVIQCVLDIKAPKRFSLGYRVLFLLLMVFRGKNNYLPIGMRKQIQRIETIKKKPCTFYYQLIGSGKNRTCQKWLLFPCFQLMIHLPGGISTESMG